MLYLIGALSNPRIPEIGNQLRKQGIEVFEDWFSPGPDADVYFQQYARGRGWTYAEALASPHAQTVFNFDKSWLERADVVVMVMPCGKSGHLELGWCLGRGVPGFILYEGEVERFDLMHLFADGIFSSVEELTCHLKSVL